MKTIPLCIILLTCSFILLKTENINGAIFVSLVCISISTSLIIYFENRLEYLGFGKLKAKLKSIEEKTNAIIIKQSEPNASNGGTLSATLPAITCEESGSDDETKSVVKAISGTKYTFRNIEGIIADSDLPSEIAKDKLNWLLINKLADSFNIDGEKLYALSPKGSKVFAQILNPPKPKA